MFSILRKRTASELLKCQEANGTPTGRLPGGHIDDLASLGKCVWFCQQCKVKFNHKAYRYEVKPALPMVRGNCDGCGTFGHAQTLYAPIPFK